MSHFKFKLFPMLLLSNQKHQYFMLLITLLKQKIEFIGIKEVLQISLP